MTNIIPLSADEREQLEEIRAFQAELNRPVSFASFSFNGEYVELTERQFLQAVADGKLCRCNTCLACRARQYQSDSRGQ